MAQSPCTTNMVMMQQRHEHKLLILYCFQLSIMMSNSASVMAAVCGTKFNISFCNKCSGQLVDNSKHSPDRPTTWLSERHLAEKVGLRRR